MEEISNKTIAYLMIAAIIVVFGSTWLILSNQNVITGFQGSNTSESNGTVTVNVSDDVNINVTTTDIVFKDVSPGKMRDSTNESDVVDNQSYIEVENIGQTELDVYTYASNYLLNMSKDTDAACNMLTGCDSFKVIIKDLECNTGGTATCDASFGGEHLCALAGSNCSDWSAMPITVDEKILITSKWTRKAIVGETGDVQDKFKMYALVNASTSEPSGPKTTTVTFYAERDATPLV